MKTKIRLIIITLAVLLTGSLPVQVFAEDYTASTMRLLRHEGTVEITDASGKKRAVLENVRFSSGEAMTTGKESLASVSLDTTKIVTMDEKSSVQFEQDGDSLALTLKEGSLLLDVQEKLDENESLDIETSTMVVGIRGTVVDVQLEKSESAANDTGGETTKLDVLEGNVEGSYLDPNGVKKIFKAAAGQRVTFIDQDGDHCPDRTPEVKDLAYNEIPEFVKQVIQNGILIH